MDVRAREPHKLLEAYLKSIVQPAIVDRAAIRGEILSRHEAANRQGRLVQDKSPHRSAHCGPQRTDRSKGMAHKTGIAPRGREHRDYIVILAANGIGGGSRLASPMTAAIHHEARKLA
jgi:hypothetical protein